MGREALEVAISNYRTGKTVRKILDGKVVCTCFGVTEREIERAVLENNLITVEQVTNYCKAGGGCGNCQPEIENIIQKIQKQKKITPANDNAEKMTNLQKIRLIEETINNEIRPLLKTDGGDIELVDISGNRVIISFRGMCAKCEVAEFTMKDVVEAKLKEFVSKDIVVEEAKS